MIKSFLLIECLLLTVFLSGCDSCDKWLNEFAKVEIEGTIERVILHHKNHDSQRVHIRHKNGELSDYDFSGTNFDFLLYIRKGDIIYKKKGSLKVKIIRDSRVKHFTISCLKKSDPVPHEFYYRQ